MSSMYTMKIKFPSSFTLYKIQGLVFHFLNPDLWAIVLMHSLNQKHAACKRLWIDFISVKISLYM